MKRRDFLRGAIAGASSVALSGMGAIAGPQPSRRSIGGAESRPPNIIFILADDLGYSELGCYGNTFNETPNLDRLARQGMRFTDAYAAAPVCSPYRASLMTGQWPARVGITDYLRPNDEKFLSPEHITFVELLRARGYATGMIGKWHLTGYVRNEGAPKLHGFDEVICSETSGIGGGDYWHPYRHAKHVKALSRGEYLTDRVALEAVDFIERHKDEPFFLYVSHYSVHTALDGKPGKVAKYAKKPGAGTGRRPNRNNPKLAAMLESIDECAGAVTAALDKHGLADNTIVVFTSDNGGESRVTSNAPLRAGKSTLYEGGIREPLLVRWPGKVKAGSVCRTPTSSVDFYPTFLALTGTKGNPKQKLDGVSLAPLLRGTGKLAPRPLYWHYPLARPHFLGGRSGGAMRKGDLKLIEFFDTGEVELYNLASDVGEAKNLAKARPDDVAALRAELAAWRKEVGAVVPKPGPPARRTGTMLHLTFDEPAGSKHAKDRSGCGRRLEYHGTTPAPGRSGGSGKARRFDGKADRLALPRPQAPRPARLPITVAAWVRPSGPDGVILAHGGDRCGYALYLQGGKPAFTTAINWKRTTLAGKPALPDGWVKLTAELREGGRMRLLVGDRLVAEARAPGLLATNPGDSIEIGADLIKPVGPYKVPNAFAGLIDEIKIDYGPRG